MKNKKGQNIAEYVIVIGIVGTVLMAMTAYFQRGIQSAIKAPLDNLGGFGSGIFSPQRVQELGIEDNIDDEHKPEHPLTSTSTFDNGNGELTRTDPGGSRHAEIFENNTIIDSTEESYQEMSYDQISSP